MSSQPAPAPVPETTPKEIPQLTDAYRKAHKNYVLASGLLAAWELIGITLDTQGKWGIGLKSPQAVPLILFTLVFYSGYKMTIEWLQCAPERRRNRPAKWDYRIAHTIALIAIAISLLQYLLHIQIVDLLVRHRLATEIASIVLMLGTTILVTTMTTYTRLRAAALAAFLALIVLGRGLLGLQYKGFIVVFGFGFIIIAIIALFRRVKRYIA